MDNQNKSFLFVLLFLPPNSEKFGLFYVNFSDPQLQRVPKASADFMRRVISTRTIPAH